MARNRDLPADVVELRRSAMSARTQMMVEQSTKEQDIAKRQDDLRAQQRSAEHSARDTEAAAAEAAEARQVLESFDQSLLRDSEAAKASGDLARAEELWEQHLGVSTDLEVVRGRAARLSSEAKRHAAEAAALAEPIEDVERELTRLARALHAAEQEVDKLDEQARLLEQAQEKFAEFEANAKADPEALRAAQALLAQADAIEVDEARIEAVTDSWEVPELSGGPTTPMSLPDAEPRVPPVRPAPKTAEPDGPLPDGLDVAAEQRELTSDIDALRDEASSARAAVLAKVEDRATELGLLRDQTAREQWSAEQASKAAQMQVQRETREVNEATATAERLTREAEAAAAKGDGGRAESLREDADAAAMERRVREARLQSAEKEAAEQGGLAASLKQDVRALEVTYDEVLQARRTAESALDNIEEKAMLLEQAKQKFADAERNDSSRSLREAQELVNRAEKLHIDRDAVREVLPDFPAETPGLDDANLVFDVPAGLERRVAASNADAASAREQLLEEFATRGLDDFREADLLRVEKAASDEAADTVELRRLMVIRARSRIADQEREAQAAEANGDVGRANEIREDARINAAILRQGEQLLAEAEEADAKLRPRADQIQRRLDEITATKEANARVADAAEAELDKLEQQAKLLDEAHAKFAEASVTRDPATLRAARARLAEAEAIAVDRAVVRVYLPDFPVEEQAAQTAPTTVDPRMIPEADVGAGEIEESELDMGASVLGDDDAPGGSGVLDDDEVPAADPPADSSAPVGETLEPSEFDTAIAAADGLDAQFSSWFDSDVVAAGDDAFAAVNTFSDPSPDSFGGEPDSGFGVDDAAGFDDGQAATGVLEA